MGDRHPVFGQYQHITVFADFNLIDIFAERVDIQVDSDHSGDGLVLVQHSLGHREDHFSRGFVRVGVADRQCSVGLNSLLIPALERRIEIPQLRLLGSNQQFLAHGGKIHISEIRPGIFHIFQQILPVCTIVRILCILREIHVVGQQMNRAFYAQ
ncbi:hypothetical protein D1872_224790 [compost metagenome]